MAAALFTATCHATLLRFGVPDIPPVEGEASGTAAVAVWRCNHAWLGSLQSSSVQTGWDQGQE